MRVVSGDFRGHKLKAVPGNGTRPTTDKVKESLFNMIGPYFEGGTSLDLYGGSGGLSIEAVSRGIQHAVLIDHHYSAIKTIKENIAAVKHPEQFTVYKQEAAKALNLLQKNQQSFDLVFLDPPYAQQHIVDDMTEMAKMGLLKDHAVIVAETDQNAQLPEDIPGFEFIKQQDYGITVIKIYHYEEE